MKKFLLIISLTILSPTYASCLIDSIDSVCSLPEFRQEHTPIFKENNINTSNPSIQLQPLGRTDPMDKMRESNNSLNYNSGCQFGICVQNPNESRLPEKVE